MANSIEIPSKVAGTTHKDPMSGKSRQELIRRYVRPGTLLIVEREPDNPYGEGHAVKLILERKGRLRRKRYHLGYVTKRAAPEVDAALRAGKRVDVIVMDVTGGTKEKPSRGVNVMIRWRE